ncbi:MAG: hypothetical protein M3466_03395, partial [Gemmatimonadota bacterium]|nr:hypothetical protein [Gemmatimonadota bacterium]
PYPFPDTGEFAPGLQPTGFSSFFVDVDVNDGGQAVFSYLMQTYDAGVWDWYDITLQTPSGNIPLVAKLGKPGRDFGTYWSSPRTSIAQPLGEWRNQRVRFLFRVQQDGWGDQTEGQVLKFKLQSCSVPALTEITDAEALEFENGRRIDVSRLTVKAGAGLSCMTSAVAEVGGNFRLSSAFRPAPYQSHLREVWDRWKLLRNNTSSECEILKAEVRTEFTNHGLQLSQRPAAASNHSQGIAIDASISGLPSGETVDTIAEECGMFRPWPVRDPPHYQPR